MTNREHAERTRAEPTDAQVHAALCEYNGVWINAWTPTAMSKMRRTLRAGGFSDRDSDLSALVARLDYNQLSLLSGLAQSELGNRNMRARADNGEDGSGW